MTTETRDHSSGTAGRLAGKVAIVAGGTAGIGEAVSRAFVRKVPPC